MTILKKITDFINELNGESIAKIFTYNNDAPLIFTQLYFWVFFALVLGVYSVVYKKNKVRQELKKAREIEKQRKIQVA